MRGLGIGSATVTATNPNFSSATTLVSSTGNVNIVQASATFRPAFTTSVTVRLESGGNPVAAPAPGLNVTLTPADTGCLSVPASVTIPTGLVSATVDLNYGGTTALPCNTTLLISSSGLTGDSISVTVNPDPTLTLQGMGLTVGAGLQTNFNPQCCAIGAILGEAQHGGRTVRFTSSNPAVAVVAANASSIGSEFVDVVVPNGQTFAAFYVQGVEGATGSVTVTATATGFGNASGSVTVAQPAFQIISLLTSMTELATNNDFGVRIGLRSVNDASVQTVQAVRAGHSVTATLTNSNAAIAQLLKQGSPAGQSQTVTIAAGSFDSPSSLGTGGVSLDPLGDGSTTVSATLTGFFATTAAVVNVTINPSALTMQGFPLTVGAGLQSNFNPQCCQIGVVLNGSQHGGVTVRFSTSDPAVVQVAANATSLGATFVDVPVPNGQTFAGIWVQGVEGVTGSATITATTPLFNDTTGTVTVVQPAFQIISLLTSTTSLSPSNDFGVRIGLPGAGNLSVGTVQTVRHGHAVIATVDNSNAAVAQLLKQAFPAAQSHTVTIAANAFDSPSSLASGGLSFDPVGAGSTTVNATIPGFIATTASSVGVTVTSPGMTMQGFPVTVGAGLQTNFNPQCCQIGVVLGGSQHGGVTVRFTTSDPAVVQVSTSSTSAGATFVDVPVPNGQTFAGVWVQGLEGVTGNATITATTTLFGDVTGTVTVAQPALQIISLSTSTTSLSPNSDFAVRIGLPGVGNASVGTVQAVRPGHSVTATINNSNSAVASPSKRQQRERSVTDGDGRGGSFDSPSTCSLEASASTRFGGGSTQVTAQATGFLSTTAATVGVTVTAPAMTAQGFGLTVGAGLQTNFNPQCCQIGAVLGGSQHGGVSVRFTSSIPPWHKWLPMGRAPEPRSSTCRWPTGRHLPASGCRAWKARRER